MRTYLSVAVLAAGLAGCGPNHFVKGHALAPAQAIDIVTVPAGAVASNGFGNSCTTPCKLPLLTADNGEITIAKQGYRTERHHIGVQVSDRRIARQAADYAVEAIDPDPVSIGLTALGHLASGRGGVQELERRAIRSDLIPLAEGEIDELADDKPLTGERIPIDLAKPVRR